MDENAEYCAIVAFTKDNDPDADYEVPDDEVDFEEE